MIAALSSVRPRDVVACFEELTYHIQNVYNNECDSLQDYFKDAYIGQFCQNTKCCHPLILVQVNTNNSMESWHMSFQGPVSVCHPTI